MGIETRIHQLRGSHWELEDGIYQINGAPRDSHQSLFENEIVRIENGEITQYLSKEQAKAIFTK